MQTHFHTKPRACKRAHTCINIYKKPKIRKNLSKKHTEDSLIFSKQPTKNAILNLN